MGGESERFKVKQGEEGRETGWRERVGERVREDAGEGESELRRGEKGDRQRHTGREKRCVFT